MRPLLLLLLLFTSLVSTSTSASAAARVGVTCRAVGSPWRALTSQCLCAPCHLCEFDFAKWACTLTIRKDTDLSDGSNVPVVQPALKAHSAWFLSQKEMTASRGGVARNDLGLASDRNLVTAFAATSEFFDRAFEDLEQTRKHERVMATGWSFADVALQPQHEIKLTGDHQANSSTRLGAVMARLVARGTELHVLGWVNLLEAEPNNHVQALLNALPRPRHGQAHFLFDDRLPDAAASHHQKTLVLKRGDGLVAYVGGIDLTSNRWDTLRHDQKQLREAADVARDDTDGWVDAHVKIEGPAAKDVAANFLARWNAHHKPLGDLLDPLFPFENPAYSALPPLDAESPLVVRMRGRHAVQIVRTFSCRYDHYEEIAPHGELSLFHARVKAIRAARHFIYIEDQYFIHVPTLLTELLAALPRLQRLIIVTQRPSSEVSLAGYDKYQFEMLAPLQQRFPNKVQVYVTKEARRLYVHSKLVLIDDVYLSIGSANWNGRSMTADTELGANVVDEETVKTPDGIKVAKLARDYRLRKFVELTGLPYDKLARMKLLDAANALDAAALDPASILEAYQIEERATFALFPDAVQDFVDPHSECPAIVTI